MMQIAIANKGNYVGIWARVIKTTENGDIRFFVINGGWYGSIQGDQVYIEDTKETYGGNYITWQGKAPFPESSYNEAMEWIRTQIDPNAPPPRIKDWILIPQKVYEDDEYKKYNSMYDDLDDDVAF